MPLTEGQASDAVSAVNTALAFEDALPGPSASTDKLEERQTLKERLAAAFRIFAKYGFDEGVGAFFIPVLGTP